MAVTNYQYNTDLETKQFLNQLFQSDSVKTKTRTMQKHRNKTKPTVQYIELSESEEDPFAGDSNGDEYEPSDDHDNETESNGSERSASSLIERGKRKVRDRETNYHLPLKYNEIGKHIVSLSFFLETSKISAKIHQAKNTQRMFHSR